MKLTCLLLAASLHVAARAYSQNINYSGKNISLQEVFSAIEQQTDYTFFYKSDWLKETHRVSVEFRDKPLLQVLELCFKDQPFGYSINGLIVTLEPKGKRPIVMEVPADSAAPGKGVRIHGKVFNEAGQPLAGATVTVRHSNKSTLTNEKGEFELNHVGENNTLVISYIGYANKFVIAMSAESIVVSLSPAVNELDKAVVQAYGVTSQRLSTGDIATVTAAEIEKQPVLNPLMALQGRVAGLDIQQTSGYASAPIKATIRGISSVDPNQIPDPLYIIDGVPLTVLNIGKTANNATGSYGFLQNPGLIGPAGGQSPLFSLNPNDIESISVLKDADATSIYGSRGANGVILITTKSGKPGKTHLNIHVDEGVTKVTRFWKMLNTSQYLAMRREAFKNDGIIPTVSNAQDLLVYDTTHYTDWERALYGNSGNVVNTQLGLTGGDVHTTFRLSAAYARSRSITTASGADQRASVSFSLSHHSSDQRLAITFTNGFSYTQSDMIQLPGRITYAPDAPSIYDSSGKLNWKQWNDTYPGATGINPFGVLFQPYTAKTNFLNSSLSLSYNLFRGLTLSTNLGYNSGQDNQIQLIPIASQDPASQPTGGSQFGINNNKNWVVQPQLSYEGSIGPGNFTILIAGSMQETTTDGIFISASGYNSDALIRTVSNAPSQSSNESYSEYRYASVFGRINYNIANKYIVNINLNRDGSSNYGPGNEFGNFASIGAAWIFTDENWFKQHFSFLSFGKLQASYGTTGSDGGIPYGYITRWTSNGLLPYTGVEPIIATQHANPDYQWQINRKMEGSISVGLFRDWITVRTSFYRSRTNNQLLSYPTPVFSGFGSVEANLPALVQNKGWEITIGGRGVHTKYFSWAPSINFSMNQNKFISFPGLGSSPYRNSGIIGQPLNGAYLLHYTGVDPQTGKYTYEDRDHDGAISINYIYPSGGDLYFKKLSPTIATGFGFNFDLKGFDLSLFFNLKKQTGMNALAQGSAPGRSGFNQPIGVLNRWQKPGDIVNVGKFSTISQQDPNGFLSSSDIGYTDASFIRLQNLSLSYRLPESYSKRAGMQSFDLFIHANNIFIITKYKGIDPETQSFGGLPPTRTITGGLSVNF